MFILYAWYMCIYIYSVQSTWKGPLAPEALISSKVFLLSFPILSRKRKDTHVSNGRDVETESVSQRKSYSRLRLVPSPSP